MTDPFWKEGPEVPGGPGLRFTDAEWRAIRIAVENTLARMTSPLEQRLVGTHLKSALPKLNGRIRNSSAPRDSTTRKEKGCEE